MYGPAVCRYDKGRSNDWALTSITIRLRPLPRTPMTQDFDPYHVWLGIPTDQQPANHYRLLGIETFEDDPDVIASAADKQMAHLRTFQAGRHGRSHAKDPQRGRRRKGVLVELQEEIRV